MAETHKMPSGKWSAQGQGKEARFCFEAMQMLNVEQALLLGPPTKLVTGSSLY